MGPRSTLVSGLRPVCFSGAYVGCLCPSVVVGLISVEQAPHLASYEVVPCSGTVGSLEGQIGFLYGWLCGLGDVGLLWLTAGHGQVPVWLSVQPGVLSTGTGPLVGGAGSLVLIQ